MVCLFFFLPAWLQGPRVNGAAGRRTVGGATVWVCACVCTEACHEDSEGSG